MEQYCALERRCAAQQASVQMLRALYHWLAAAMPWVQRSFNKSLSFC